MAAGAPTNDQIGSFAPIDAFPVDTNNERPSSQCGVAVAVLVARGVTDAMLVRVRVAVEVDVGKLVRVGVRVAVETAVPVDVAVAVNVGGVTRHGTRSICPVRTPLRSNPVGV